MSSIVFGHDKIAPSVSVSIVSVCPIYSPVFSPFATIYLIHTRIIPKRWIMYYRWCIFIQIFLWLIKMIIFPVIDQ